MSHDRPQTVLMFHGIGTATQPLEAGEADYWISWEQFDAILDYCASLPTGACLFTFDDGNASDLEAARRMRQRGVGGSFFVLAGRIDAPGYLSRDDLHALTELGMEVGLHGRDHVDWRRADDPTLTSEVDAARTELEASAGTTIDTVAIPYGAYDRRVWKYLRDRPFRRIYTSDRGRSRPSDRFVRRDPVMRWHGVQDIAKLVAGQAPLSTRLRAMVMPAIKRLI